MASPGKICKKCIGISECNKYCPISAGKNIANFIDDIDKTDTNIGDFRKDNPNKPETFVIMGIMLEKMSSPINIMKLLPSTGISIKGKLSDNWSLSPTQILKTYLDYTSVPKNEQQAAIDNLKRFNSAKVIPTPVKVGTDIEVTHVGSDNKKRKTVVNVRAVEWRLDLETGNLNGLIYTDISNSNTGAKLKLNMEDYGSSWILPNIERNLKTAEIDRAAIKMLGTGLILPIEICSSDGVIVLDGQHMYLVKSDGAYIIGTWGQSGMVENTEITNSLISNKSYRKVKSIIKFVEKHRRFIIPYGLSSTNKITI